MRFFPVPLYHAHQHFYKILIIPGLRFENKKSKLERDPHGRLISAALICLYPDPPVSNLKMT